jgi:hypothetical protein
MIENIRKYRGLILFFLALVIVSLVVGIKDDIFRGGIGGQAVYRINGRSYSDKEFKHLGSGAFELVGGLARAGDFSLYQFLIELAQGATSEEDAGEKFFINRIILREAKDEFGIHPGDEEITDYIRSLQAFADKNGKFSQETYNNFIEKGIGRLGMTESDLRELASDAIASRKLNSIVGGGLVLNRDALIANRALADQMISGSTARIDIAPVKAGIQPKDEEIKSYWESIQDAFMTAPKRKFTYFIATPKPVAKPVGSIDYDSLNDEQKKQKQQEQEAAAKEESRKNQIELDGKVDEFSFKLEEQKGAGFEELAAKNQWQVKTTGMFSKDEAPEDLAIKLRSTSLDGKAIDELFRIEPTNDPLSKFSQPIAVGDNQWLVARLDGEEKPRAKTFEEARDEARAQFIEQKAAEALRKAAHEASEKIKNSLAAGKSFAAAAKEAGIADSNVKAFSKLKSSDPADSATRPSALFENSSTVDTGSLAAPVIEKDRAFIVHVTAREITADLKAEESVKTLIESSAIQNESLAFGNWLRERLSKAKVESLFKR